MKYLNKKSSLDEDDEKYDDQIETSEDNVNDLLNDNLNWIDNEL